MPAAMANASGEAGYQWTGATGASDLGLPGRNISFQAPVAWNTATLPMSLPAPIRCDNATPGRPQIGSVVPAVTPGIRYDSTWFTEFGPHVTGAQASALPGATDANPLHRLVDATLKTQNRNTACPSSLPRPTGKSCDEYPFASTFEGPYLNGGGPRTQPWCQVTISGAPSTGPTGYSVCMIDATQISAARSLLNSVLYSPYRVIAGDAFTVQIV